MKLIQRAAFLTAVAMILLSGMAQAQCYISNGDFESGTSNWTKTSGYFAVLESPAGSGNDVASLRGAGGYTSTIEQTFTAAPGAYAVYLETSGHSTCTTTLTAVSGGDTFTNSAPSNLPEGAFTLDFRIPSGSSSATLKISVTCSGLGRYVSNDNACVIYAGP